MTYSIPIHNGIITFVTTDFKCPECGELHTEEDYYSRLSRAKRGLIFKKCKGCKIELGITSDIKGDIVVFIS